MSQSPSEQVSSQTAINYVSALNELVRLVESGLSHSGHERNCCFLNAGNGSFADVSVISGFDFQDDARAIAPVDWDGDGDLDLWVANRTGPQVRFMQNRIGDRNNHVAFRLRGTTVNRDAIGARVMVRLKGSDKPILRTLHAGSGFLSQGSKRLVIGIGRESEIAEVTVRWPGGKEEKFAGAIVNQKHLLVQDSGKCELVESPLRDVQLKPQRVTSPPATAHARVFFDARPPMPALRYTRLNGDEATRRWDEKKPVLLNLWATWCAPCVKELSEFKSRYADLEKQGLEVLALSVDGLANEERDPAVVQRFTEQRDFPFQVGLAEADSIEKLELLIRKSFGRHQALPVPTSVLIDQQGNVAALYFGVVKPDVLLGDIAHLGDDALQRRKWGDPFAGRWHTPPQAFRAESLAEGYLHAGYPHEAIAILDQRTNGAQSVTSHNLLGAALVAVGDHERAEAQFRKALETNPGYIRSQYNLGVVYASQGKVTEAIELFKQVIETAPDYADARFSLAHAYESQQRWLEAEGSYREVLRIDPQFLAARNGLGVVLARRGLLDQAAANFSLVLGADATNATAHHNLGLVFMQQQQLEKAAEHLTRALDGSDDNADVRNSLGVVLANLNRVPEAIEQYRAAVATRPEDANFHYNLAAALHRQREVEEAMRHYRRAYELAPQRPLMANALAWMLATCRDEELRDPAKAVKLSEAANAATNHVIPEMLDTLSAAYASAGEWEKAESTARTALTIARSSNKQSLAEEINARLQLYRQKKPYVEP